MHKWVATGVSTTKIALIIEAVMDETALLESGFPTSQLIRAYQDLFNMVCVVDELPLISVVP